MTLFRSVKCHVGLNVVTDYDHIQHPNEHNCSEACNICDNIMGKSFDKPHEVTVILYAFPKEEIPELKKKGLLKTAAAYTSHTQTIKAQSFTAITKQTETDPIEQYQENATHYNVATPPEESSESEHQNDQNDDHSSEEEIKITIQMTTTPQQSSQDLD